MGKKISFKEKYDENHILRKEFDYEKNKGVDVNGYIHRDTIIDWKCSTNPEHFFKSKLSNRAAKKTPKCPFCNGRRKLFIEEYAENEIPRSEFDHFDEEYDGLNLDINKLTSGSKYRIWWKCSVNPDHLFVTALYNRTSSNSTKCSWCNGRRKLFIDEYPPDHYLRIEYDHEENEKRILDINTVSCGSEKSIFSWKCSKNSEHGKFEATMNERCDLAVLKGCAECSKISRKINGKNTTEKGDEIEDYVTNLLLENNIDELGNNIFREIVKIGNTASSGDIKISNNTNTYYIQVKTMVRVGQSDSYSVTHLNNYENNMLIVCVNREKDRFSVNLNMNFEKNSATFNFGNGSNIVQNNYNMYKGDKEDKEKKEEKKFVKKIIELIPGSCEENYMNEKILKEYQMIGRLIVFCSIRNVTFVRNTTNRNAIDGFLYNPKDENSKKYTVQCKYVSLPESKFKYSISFEKNTENYNTMPYEFGDFDFLIIEVGGIKNAKNIFENKYEGNFCIIPSMILEKKEIFKNDLTGKKGKHKITICYPDSLGSHYSKEFWNKIPDELL